MITVWTLLVLGWGDAGYTTVKTQAIFLSKEECVRIGQVLAPKFERGSSLCYESNRLDVGGK